MEINHANQLAAMQNRLINMERSQANRFHLKQNDKWQKKPPSQEHRLPSPLETNNMVDHQVIPYCRPCGESHEESTCLNFLEISEDGSANEQVCMFSQSYNVPGESLVGSGESNNYMDKVTETYGPKPSPKQVAKMAKYRGITYQKRGKQNQEKTQASAP